MSGPTHRSAPTNSIETSLNPGRSGRGQSPAPTVLPGCQATGRCGHRPLRDEREAPSTALASGAGRSICASGRKGWVGHAAESIPEVSSNLGHSLSRPPGVSSLCTREPCPMGDGRAGGHIGPPLRGHRNSQQRQTGRDRARPLQKDGEYAEGWGDERTQGRFDIYRAVIGLVSRKAECPE